MIECRAVSFHVEHSIFPLSGYGCVWLVQDAGATACARCLPVVGDTTDRTRTVEVLARKASLQSQIHGAYRNVVAEQEVAEQK